MAHSKMTVPFPGPPNPDAEIPEHYRNREVLVWDELNPVSVINLVPPMVADRLREARAKAPEFFDLDEHRLYRLLSSRSLTPTPTDNRMRLKFWMEYDNQLLKNDRFLMSRAFSGVMASDTFYKNFLCYADRIAWMICPPTNYLVKAEEALEYGLEQLRDLLMQPHVDESGKVNTKLGELKAKIVAMLDLRLKGGIVQKQLTVTSHLGKTGDQGQLENMTVQELEVELNRAKERFKKLENGGRERRVLIGNQEEVSEAEVVSEAGETGQETSN